MNPFKNISVFRNQQDCNLKPWSDEKLQVFFGDHDDEGNLTEVTEFPRKEDYDTMFKSLKGNTDYARSQLDEIINLKKEIAHLKKVILTGKEKYDTDEFQV